nr:recombinase family protein [Candidatus Omnitrophota bacterium]
LPLSKSHIYTILRNPIYVGKIKYAGKLSQGNHDPIISQDIFDLAQEIHKKKVRKLRLYKNYSLAGLIKCKECGSHMTSCHTNKYKKSKMKRYYYYRCTSTFKKDWNTCKTRQVSANRLEDYIFQNLERISNDKHYIDSLLFRLRYAPVDNRKGLEPSQSCFVSANISPENFTQTLQYFIKILPEKKGIEKNLWVKKFIKRVDYSKEEIALSLYYKSFKGTNYEISASGRVEENAGRNLDIIDFHKSLEMPGDSSDHTSWLPDSDSFQTIPIVLPNNIHACKRKNL